MPDYIHLTDHARARIRERDLCPDAVAEAVRLGVPVRSDDGAVVLELDTLRVVVGRDGCVVTAWDEERLAAVMRRRGKKRLLKSQTRRRRRNHDTYRRRMKDALRRHVDTQEGETHER
jgi:hypothetical protein